AVTAETLPSRSDGFRPQRLDRLHLRGPRQQIARFLQVRQVGGVAQERLRGGRVPVLLVHHQDVPVRVRGAVDVGLVPVVGLDRLRHVPTPDLDQLVPLARLDRVPEEQCVRCVGAHTADSRCTDHGPRVAGRHGGPCDTGTTRSDPPHPAGSTAFCDVSPERPCPGLRWDPTNCGGMSRIAVEFHRTRSSVPSLLSTTLSVTLPIATVDRNCRPHGRPRCDRTPLRWYDGQLEWPERTLVARQRSPPRPPRPPPPRRWPPSAPSSPPRWVPRAAPPSPGDRPQQGWTRRRPWAAPPRPRR